MATSILSSSGNRGKAMLHVVERCKQDPQLADAVHCLLDVCEQIDREDPGAGVEFVKAIKEMGDFRRQAKEIQ